MKSGWMRLARAAAVLALAGGLWAQGAGAAEVKNVTAEYSWPWGVEIRYEVVGTVSADPPLIITATDRANNTTYTSQASALSGDTGAQTGAHKVLWELDKQGIKLQSTNVVFTVMYEPLYCVVDLSGGANASSYPVTYLDTPPSGGFNTDEYKTTKLVLRRIPAGSFTMGSPTNEYRRYTNEIQHKVTLTKAFYIGLFEVTRSQYMLVMESNSAGSKYPVVNVSWNTIRGNTNWPASSAVSASSFMGRLRARTGLEFDLPTEAQWEYACRAGTMTAFSYGASENGDYMWYYYNAAPDGAPAASRVSREVGMKKPNAWGLYDMHGNVEEWCLDRYTLNLGTAAVTDPKGASSGSYRLTRGGNCQDYGYDCRSAYRGGAEPENWHSRLGFRLTRSLSK